MKHSDVQCQYTVQLNKLTAGFGKQSEITKMVVSNINIKNYLIALYKVFKDLIFLKQKTQNVPLPEISVNAILK